jgi:hypothetical protein
MKNLFLVILRNCKLALKISPTGGIDLVADGFAPLIVILILALLAMCLW